MRSRWKWSQKDLDRLEGMICEGLSDSRIGRVLGCTAGAVNIARKRNGIAPRREVLLTAREVARRLGVGCSKVVARWIVAGYLRGRKGQRCGLNRMWYVTEDALSDFLEDPRFYHLWDPSRIRPSLKWAAATRDGTRFLTTGEVGRLLYVRPHTVSAWIHKGYLPAVRRGNWLIREGDLSGFVAPCDRPRSRLAVSLSEAPTETS